MSDPEDTEGILREKCGIGSRIQDSRSQAKRTNAQKMQDAQLLYISIFTMLNSGGPDLVFISASSLTIDNFSPPSRNSHLRLRGNRRATG